MPENEKMVRFNLKNVAYAILTESEQNGVTSYTFGTPKKVPGAVTLDMSSNMSFTPFYADGVVYYLAAADSGKTGTLTMARFPDEMLKEVWGMEEDDVAHVITENINAETKHFALLYQIDLNNDQEYYVLYDCVGTKPNIGSTTNTETKTPQTQQTALTVRPLEDGNIMSRTTRRTPTAVRNSWYTDVYVKRIANLYLSSLTIGTNALVPTFDASVLNYDCTTINSGDAITAAIANPQATVEIKNGDTVVTNGGTATWQDGENVLTIKVSADGQSQTYTVTVTKADA